MYFSKNAKQDSLISWIICLSAAGFFFFDFVQISMMNTLHQDLISALGIPSGRAGYYINIPFSVGNWVWIFPAAFLIDRFSIRKVTVSMLALSILGALGTAWSHHAWLTALFRFVSGSAHAFCFLCCTTLVTRWFSPKQRATVMSIAVAIGISGLLAAQLPLHYLNRWLGWRGALSVNAALGGLCWIVAFLFVADYPLGQKASTTLEKNPLQGFVAALKNGQAWLYSLCTAFLNAPIVGIVFSYLNQFLIAVHGVKDLTFASGMASLLFLGHIIGVSFAGFISNRWQSRKKPLCWASLVALCLFSLFVFYTPLSPKLIACLLFLFGIILGAQVISYPAIVELSNPALAATSMSIASFVIMGSIPIVQAATDYALQSAVGMPPKAYYSWGFAPVMVALVASTLITLLLRESYPKNITLQPTTKVKKPSIPKKVTKQ